MIEWHRFDYADKAGTSPSVHDEPHWIMDQLYSPDEVTIGYYDGYTWRTWTGSDDCSVTHWAEIKYPEAPEV